MRTYYKNGSLCLYILTRRGRALHQGYKYLVQHDGMAYRAFNKRDTLREYLREYGLKIGRRVSDRGVYLLGEYTENMLLDVQEYNRQANSPMAEKSAIVNNGEWTECIINRKTKTWYYLNPNCPRKVFDWPLLD